MYELREPHKHQSRSSFSVPGQLEMRAICVLNLMLAVLFVRCRVGAQGDNTEEQKNNAVRQGQQNTAALYNLIRSIAFPESPTLDDSPNLESRFILLMPGKVLNYFDYYPGREYTKFIQVSSILRCVRLRS